MIVAYSWPSMIELFHAHLQRRQNTLTCRTHAATRGEAGGKVKNRPLLTEKPDFARLIIFGNKPQL